MSIEPEKRNMVVTRVFEASVEQVWQAWRDPALVRRWWGPEGFTSPLAEMDFREGGTSFVCMRAPKEYGGQDLYNIWTYQKIVPMQRIEFIQNFADKEGNQVAPAELGLASEIPFAVRHVITFKALDDNQTELTVTEYGYPSEQIAEISRTGMNQCLDKMTAIFMASERREFQRRMSEIKESLAGMNPREIDTVLSQARVELFKPKPFEELAGMALFERQVSRMIDRRYPDLMGLSKTGFRGVLDPLRKIIEGYQGGDTPFLIVIPPNIASMSDQLSLIEYEGSGVTQFLKDEDFINREGILTPTEPYIVTKVEVGDRLLDVSADSAFEGLVDNGRSPLTISEGAALLIQYPHVLDFMNTSFAGTVHRSGHAIDMYVYAGAVKLKRDPGYYADPRWGVPSCERRISS
jgi:uncharacterized protein YndB with AHSA1/START domain